MSKFQTVLNTISLTALTVGAILMIGSIVTSEHAVNETMNPIQKGFVFQKNLNEMAAYSIHTVANQKQDDYLFAFGAAWVSLPFLCLEASIYTISMLILAKNAK